MISKKQKFLYYMEKISKKLEHDKKAVKALNDVFSDTQFVTFDNSSLLTDYIELLQEYINDKIDAINYFFFETDQGESDVNMISFDGDKQKFILKTYEDVYNCITEYNKYLEKSEVKK